MGVQRTLAGAVFLCSVVLISVVVSAAPASAQGFGIGARLAWVTSNADVDVDSERVRFVGGQIRLGGGRLGLEVSMDFHTESLEAVNQKIKERPLQVSLLLRLAQGSFQPYLLGGPGWYKRSTEPIEGPADDLEASTTEFGWHAGGGLEVLLGRHVGIHGDYRYTFLDFGDGLFDFDNLLPGHKGSMWTLGATVYF